MKQEFSRVRPWTLRSFGCATGFAVGLFFSALSMAQAQPENPASAALHASSVRGVACDTGGLDCRNSEVRITNVIGTGVARVRGPQGPSGPPGPPGANGVVHVVAGCASCPSQPPSNAPASVIAPIAAAFVAGLFGLLGLIIAKEQKTSEFRQAWIDALRNDLADFSSSGKSFLYYESLLADAKRTKTQGGAQAIEYEKMLKETFEQLVHSQSRIRLRINPAETDSAMKGRNDTLLAAIANIRRAVNADLYDEAEAALDSLHEKAAPVLKAEWARVKRGESPYVFSKVALVILIVVTLVGLVTVLVKALA